MECDYCGHVGDDVVTTYDPYVLELFGEFNEVTWCAGCLQDRADDV